MDELIGGACDVCYRNYKHITLRRKRYLRPASRTSLSSISQYLGENPSNRTEFHSLQSFIAKKLKNKNLSAPKEFVNDLKRICRCLQESRYLHSLSHVNMKYSMQDLMSYWFGSEERVRANRLFFAAVDDCLKISDKYTNVSSGSKAEGYVVPGVDYDLMTILDHIIIGTEDSTTTSGTDDLTTISVTEDSATVGGREDSTTISRTDESATISGTEDTTIISGTDDSATICGTDNSVTIGGIDNRETDRESSLLYVDTNNSYPGFSYLKIAPSPYSDDLLKHWGIESEFGPLVSNEKFKEYFIKRYRENDVTVHGPCISDQNGTVDHLFCFRMTKWPRIARQWITRNRHSDWPSDCVISNVVHQSVLLVPIGSKFGAQKDSSLEWRISFSLSEKQLIHSFNHTQFLCYTIFKWVKKEVSKYFIRQNIFCSYFIKSTMFWLCEEMPKYFWTANNSLYCLLEIRKRLLYWTKYRFCPHYFIPENNLFEGLLSDELKSIAYYLENFIFAAALNHFTAYPQLDVSSIDGLYMYITTKNKSTERTKAILTLTFILRNIVRSNTILQNKAVIKKSVSRITNKNMKISYFPKGIYLLTFCYGNQCLAQAIPLTNTNNKSTYRNRKQIMSHLLCGIHSDAIAGWILISMFFYETCQFTNALFIANFAVQKCSDPSMITMTIIDTMFRHLNLTHVWNMQYFRSLLEQMKLSCIDLVYFHPSAAWRFQVLYTDFDVEFSQMPSIVLANFIRCLCFHKTGSIEERDRSLSDIILENRKQKHDQPGEDIPGKLVTYAILAKTYRIFHDNRAADYWTNHLHRYWKKHRKIIEKMLG